jgi:hypothetical protein
MSVDIYVDGKPRLLCICGHTSVGLDMGEGRVQAGCPKCFRSVIAPTFEEAFEAWNLMMAPKPDAS